MSEATELEKLQKQIDFLVKDRKKLIESVGAKFNVELIAHCGMIERQANGDSTIHEYWYEWKDKE